MSSRRSGLLAPSRPRVRHAPRVHSHADADDAFEFAAAYGLRLDQWQHDVLDDWMGRTRKGEWSATICGLAVPRQNGKNAVIEVRELFGMVELGEKFLHTAHEVKTARKAFLRIASFFENPRQYPELAALVKEIRKTNGQEAVVLDNGGTVEFVARSKGSARGFTVDTVVFDEAQELQDEALEALASTNSAAPLGHPQKIFTGTPPGPKANGDIWRGIHHQGEAGKTPRMAWTDFGLVGNMPDIDDEGLLRVTNPGYPHRLTPNGVDDDRVLFKSNPEGFARERFGWWGDEDNGSDVFGPGKWAACAVADLAPPDSFVLGVAVSVDQEWSSVGAAGLIDGKVVLAANRREPGTDWLVDHVVDVAKRRRCKVVVDENGPARHLLPALRKKGLRLEETKTADFLDACAGLHKRVVEGDVAHPSHPELDAAVHTAIRRDVGDRWAWGRRKSGDISMLEAVTLAAWEVWRHEKYNLLDSVR